MPSPTQTALKAIRFGVYYGVRGTSESFINNFRRRQVDLTGVDYSEVEVKAMIDAECKRQGVKNV